MTSPQQYFTQRFGGRQLGQYNPFQGANQYASPYTPGAFQPIPTTGTPQTQTPPAGQGGAPGQSAGEGGRENGQGIAPGTGGQGAPGWAPGRSAAASVAGGLLGLAIPGAGTFVGIGNGIAGVQAGRQQAAAAGLDPTFADDFYAATGVDLFGGPNIRGRGGYGDYGYNPGGSAGALNMADPGVMGAARAQAASQVNQASPTGGIGPAPSGGLLSGAPATPTASGGLLSTTPSTPGMAVPAPTKPAASKQPSVSQGAIDAARSKAVRDAVAAARKAAGYGKVSHKELNDPKIKAKIAAARTAAEAAFDASLSHLRSSGTLSASSLSQAAQLAKSGMGLQQGKSGVSGSQIRGGQTVGNNPNDRSGRNSGAPSKAGAGGRLGGGV